ncbi:MAG: P1 family peptidase [Calditrichaeota bacterium]|nr:P1 family peptidase [Calditrichota bacterium]HQU72654.1 P1 family peptidase [Calditrichia bacterium]
MNICDVPGIRVGHATHPDQATGCTVILPDQAAVAGVSICGGAPGTRETELLRPGFLVSRIHGIMLTGGSAFGLRTADGAMQYLAERGIGFAAQGFSVPIVPGAVIFDLAEGRSITQPDARMGYLACQNAGDTLKEGLVGAGRGATVGKLWGRECSMPGGIGSAAVRLHDRVVIGALAVVNAFGDIVEGGDEDIVAGLRNPGKSDFAGTMRQLQAKPLADWISGGNTVLVAVATNAALTVEQCNRLAQTAQNGIARAVRPAHSMFDGDVVFALSCGEENADLSTVGELAAQVTAQAIIRAVKVSNGLD